jgi:hypothetical protein
MDRDALIATAQQWVPSAVHSRVGRGDDQLKGVPGEWHLFAVASP